MNSESGLPIESMPPIPGDIVLHSGLRMAVETTKNDTIRVMFSRPIYFVDLSIRNAKLLRDELTKHLPTIITS